MMRFDDGPGKRDKASFANATTRTAGILALWTGIFYVCGFIFARVSFPSDTIAMGISGLVCSLAAFGALCLLVDTDLKKNRAAALLALCLAADIGINRLVPGIQAAGEGSLIHAHAGINIALMGIAICGGILLSGIIRKPSYIIPLAIAAGLADVWSVSVGVSSEIAQSRTAMNFLLFTFPVAGRGVLPIIGVTDFMFAAMFLSLSWRFGFPIRRTQVLVAASIVVSIGIAVFAGIGVPVLPVMGLFFITGQYRYVRTVDPGERREALLGILIIAAALGVLTLIKLAIN